MPTIAEQWIEQGLEQGLAIGREKGRQEGRQQGRQEGYEEGREAALMLLRRFLKYRFGVALDHFDDDLHPLDLATITQLSDQAFEVENLAEFEAALADLAVDPKE
jgi:predicted transposase YdaD